MLTRFTGCVPHLSPPLQSTRRETLQFLNTPVSPLLKIGCSVQDQGSQKDSSERRKAHCGVDRIECVKGIDLNTEQISMIWNCYRDTISRKWGQPYMQKGFSRHWKSLLPHSECSSPIKMADLLFTMLLSVVSISTVGIGGHKWHRLLTFWTVLPPTDRILHPTWTHKFEAGAQGNTS